MNAGGMHPFVLSTVAAAKRDLWQASEYLHAAITYGDWSDVSKAAVLVTEARARLGAAMDLDSEARAS